MDLLPTPAARPSNRVIGFDLARALAIWGMVTVHFWIVLAYRQTEPAWLRWYIDMLDGRAAALFLVLAGIGISLRDRATASKDSPSTNSSRDENQPGNENRLFRRALFRRGLFLLAAGFLNLFIWEGDILRVYGVSMCLMAFLVRGSSDQILAAAIICVLGFVGLMCLTDYFQDWNWEILQYKGLWTPRGSLRSLFFNGFRSVFPWTGLLIFGVWLGRFDLSDARFRRKLLLISGGITLTVELLSAAALQWLKRNNPNLKIEEWTILIGTVSMPPLPLFLIAATSTAVAVICLSLSIAERYGTRLFIRALVACGQMAFTWYIVHLVVGLGGLETLRLEGKGTLYSSIATAAGFFAVICGISLVVRNRGWRGPLEALMRRVAG